MPFSTSRRHTDGQLCQSSAVFSRPAHGRRIEIVEHDSGALSARGIELLHRVREPAGAAHDRHGAVLAGCTSGSGRRARRATASGKCRPRPRSCARVPRCSRCRRSARPGKRSLQAVQEPLVARLAAAECDEPQVARAARSSGSVSTSRSRPFCRVSRVTMPTSGVPGAAGMRSRSSSACLFSSFARQVGVVVTMRHVFDPSPDSTRRSRRRSGCRPPSRRARAGRRRARVRPRACRSRAA